MEPRVSCPPIFANEPFPHYPPCPSFETLPPISPEVVSTLLGGILAVTLFLLFICLVAFALTLGD